MLPELLRSRGANHAMLHPEDGDRPLPGTIYVAPPDLHLLVKHDRIRLVRSEAQAERLREQREQLEKMIQERSASA